MDMGKAIKLHNKKTGELLYPMTASNMVFDPTTKKSVKSDIEEINTSIADKVDKEDGKGLSTNDFTNSDKSKLDGIADGAQVNTVTGIKGDSEASYRVGQINITKGNIGLGNVDNTADKDKNVSHASTSDSATKASQDANGNDISATYETKSVVNQLTNKVNELSAIQVNYIGYYPTADSLPTLTENSWAFVGELTEVQVYAYYATNIPDGYTEGWNVLGSLGYYDLTDYDEVKAQLTELASEADKIEIKKVDKSIGKNLFNKNSNKSKVGYYISSDGNLYVNESYVVSEYIEVLPNTAYYQRKHTGGFWALYNDSFELISVGNTNAITTTSDTAYIRITVLLSVIDTEQLEQGDSFTSYAEYTDLYGKVSEGAIVDGSVSTDKLASACVGTDKMKDKSVTIGKIDFITVGKNIVNVNSDDSKIGYYLTEGKLTPSSTYNTTEYIKVNGGDNYVCSYNGGAKSVRFCAFYDADKTFISQIQEVWKITIPDNASYMRVSANASTGWDLMQIELGTSGSDVTPYEEYNVKISKDVLPDIPEYAVKDGEITNAKIANEAVTPNKTNFFMSGNNLVNTNSENVLYGKYVSYDGAVYDNTAYNVTDYIKVTAGNTYYIGSSSYDRLPARIIAAYDKDYNFLSSEYLSNIKSFLINDGVEYIRACLYVDGWEHAQITEGSLMPYEEYNLKIKPELVGVSDASVDFYLPQNIYVAAGRTIELYYNQILLHADKYNIQAKCSIGKSLERKFQIIGDESKVGTYTLTINVYNDSAKLVVSGVSTIHIVSSTISAATNVLPIGDSLTNEKPWLAELGTLSNSLIKTVGTRNNKHEGRSGGYVSIYTSESGALLYNYDNFYKGTGYDAEIFDSSKDYSVGDIVRYPTTFGNGSSGYGVYAFTTAHSAGTWNQDEVYCISGGNPFYDFNNAKFSINFYKSFQNINYDVIMIYLGTNGISLTPETNANGALGIKNLINLIREEDATTPIVVVNTIFRSGQNGIGNQGNTDGYSAQSSYKFEEDRKVLLLGKALENMIGGMDNVYLCPVGFTHDSQYNFGNAKVAVNPRLTDTDEVFELKPYDSIHPQDCGYYQMADEMFSTICAIVNQ